MLAGVPAHAQEAAPPPVSEPAPAPPVTLPAAPPVTPPVTVVQTVAPAAPPAVSFGPKGLDVQSGDGSFVFNIRFPFMFDAKATPSDGQPSMGSAFYPRFFGPILSTKIYQSVTGKLIVGFQDRSVTVVNAWLDVAAHPWLHLRVGKMLYPISLERQTLPLRIVFLEHGIASSLLGVSEFGLQLWGAAPDKLFEYQLAFGNGAPANQHYETVPALFTGLRTGLGVAWLYVVAAELIAAEAGLGFMLTDGRELSRSDMIFAAIALLACCGKLSDGVLKAVERRLLRWHPGFTPPRRALPRAGAVPSHAA